MSKRADPWATLWTQWADLGLGAPEVVARRLGMIARQPFAPHTLAESQRMVLEKVAAASEAWWQLWLGAAALGLPVWTATGPGPRRGAARRAATIASRVVQPARKRVRANVARLRKTR